MGLTHLDAKPIHATHEDFRLFHPVFESLLANQPHRLHERARSVAEEDPVDGKMDIGFNAGRIHKIRVQIQRCWQLQLLSFLLTCAKAVRLTLVLGLPEPTDYNVQRALTRDPDLVQAAHSTKELQEGGCRPNGPQSPGRLRPEGLA